MKKCPLETTAQSACFWHCCKLSKAAVVRVVKKE